MCPFLNVFESKKKTEVVHEYPEKSVPKKAISETGVEKNQHFTNGNNAAESY